MSNFTTLTHLEELADKYDCFIFDIYGVIYSGKGLFDKTVKFIEQLRKVGKHIALLSNSQRRAREVLDELADNGFTLIKGEKAFTSGEYFREYLNQNSTFKDNHCFYNVGHPKHLAKTGLKFVNDVKDASCIVFNFMTDDLSKTNHCDDVIEHGIANNCKAICINPDITAPYGDAIMYTPGFFADKYEKRGGKVSYFGKPHKDIYEFFIDDFIKMKGFDKSRTIAIGDTLATDIKGATNFGIDSLLMLSRKGILRDKSVNDHVNVSIEEHDGVSPTYVVSIV